MMMLKQGLKHTAAIVALAAVLNPIGALADGGVIGGGGGGGALPKIPVTVKEVEYTIEHSKHMIVTWLHNFENRFRTDCGNVATQDDYLLTEPILRMLFAGPKDIFATLENLKIEVRSTSACHDINGKRTDASVHSSIPGAICISSQRLAKKLVQADMPGQVSALILHELSHLMGADEPTAKLIQKVVFGDLYFVGWGPYMGSLSRHFNNFNGLSQDAEWAMKHVSSPQVVDEILWRMNDRFSASWNEQSVSAVQHPLRAEPHQRISAEYGRWWAMQLYACSMNPTKSNAERASCLANYQRGFGSLKVKDAFDFLRDLHGPPPAGSKECRRIVSVPLKRIESEGDFRDELSSLKKFFFDSGQAAGRLSSLGYAFELVRK